MTDMFDMALESLEGVLTQRAARSCLEAGLSVQGKTVDNASLEDYRAALRSNVFRQLQVVMPATAAAQLIREVEFQLEQLDNERLESVSRQVQTRSVPPLTSSFEDGKATAIRDPDLLAMASSNLLTLNLRTLGSLSVEFGDVLFAERDLKLEVRSLRRMLDEGQNVDRARIEALRETLKNRREALLEEQQAQLVALDNQVYELSQRVVVPRELEARLESAKRLLASSTLATSDIRQMERLVESVMVPAEVVAQPEPVVSAQPEPILETNPEPVFEASPEPVLEASPERAFETSPEPAFESEASLESVPQARPEPLPDFEPEPASAFVASAASPELAAQPEPVQLGAGQAETAHLETEVFSQSEPQNWDTDEPELVQSGPFDDMDNQPEDALPDLPLMVDEPVDDLRFEPVAVVKDLAPPMADPVVLIEPSPASTAVPFRFEQRDYPTTPEWRTPEPVVPEAVAAETALQTEETEPEKTVQIGSDAEEIKALETEPADIESAEHAPVAAGVLEPEAPFEPVTVAADEVETTEDLQPDAPELAVGGTESVIPEPAVVLEPEQQDVLSEREQPEVLEATTESELDTVSHPEPEVGVEAEAVADEPEIVPVADEVHEPAMLETRTEQALEAEVEPIVGTDDIKTVPDETFASEAVADGADSLGAEPVALEADSTETVTTEPGHHEAEPEDTEPELVAAPEPAVVLEPEPVTEPETAFEAESEPESVSTLEAELAEILEPEHAELEATEVEASEPEVPEVIEAQEAETAETVEPEPLEAAEAEALEASEMDSDTLEEAESETSEPEPVAASEWETIHAAAALREPEMLEAETHEVETHEMETHEAEPLGSEPSEARTRDVESLESESLEPDVLGAAEPEMAEPEMAEPELHETQASEPASHEVESRGFESEESLEAAEQMEPEQAEPESIAVSEPEVHEPEFHQPAALEASEPEWQDAEPEASEPEPELHDSELHSAERPEPEQIEASEPEPAMLEPEAVQPDADEDITPEPAVVLEPEMPMVSPVPPIEPDRSSWYAPSFQAAAFTPSAALDATPDLSALMPSDSNVVPEREEIQVENETMDSPAAPVPAAGEEGIVWLATARRDASSRNADRLRKDPMALKPGRLESEHALAEAEAQVLEAKLHAACDGAGAQHRRLEAEFGLKVAQAAVELASKRVEAVGLRERYGAASRAELEHAQLELERSEEELKLARLSEGVAPNVYSGAEPVVNRVEVDAERLKIALQSTPQMLSARHALERAELELAIRDNPAYPASEIASVRNIVNQAREHFSTLEATLHSELEAALASLRYYGARLNERDGAWKAAENELHHAEEGVKQGFVASLTRDEAHLKALRADAERRKAAHKYLEAVHRLQCLTHQYMLS